MLNTTVRVTKLSHGLVTSNMSTYCIFKRCSDILAKSIVICFFFKLKSSRTVQIPLLKALKYDIPLPPYIVKYLNFGISMVLYQN